MPDQRSLTVVQVAGLIVGVALLGAGLVAVLLYAMPSLQVRHRYAVLAATFIPYGLVAFAGALLLAFSPVRWLRPLAVLALVGLMLLAWWARPYWPELGSSTTQPDAPVTVVTMNLRCNPPGVDDLISLADQVGPDVVVLQGVTDRNRAALNETWRASLPYSAFRPMSDVGKCGTTVWSRTPIHTLSSAESPQLTVRVELSGESWVFIAVDNPTPSKGVQPWLDAFSQLQHAATEHATGRLVLVGDFNAVLEHAPMRELMGEAGLRDAAAVARAGYVPTYPAGHWHPALIAVDHVLLGEELTATVVATATIEGQEHWALVVRLGLR